MMSKGGGKKSRTKEKSNRDTRNNAQHKCVVSCVLVSYEWMRAYYDNHEGNYRSEWGYDKVLKTVDMN